MKKKKDKFEVAKQKKLDEIATELSKTDVNDKEKIKVLAQNTAFLRNMRKEDPKGFKAWIKQIKAEQVLSISASVLLFMLIRHWEQIGEVITTRAKDFIPFNRFK